MAIQVCVDAATFATFPDATTATTPHDEPGVLHVYNGARRVATFRDWRYWANTASVVG